MIKDYHFLTYLRRSPSGYLILLKIMEHYFADTIIHIDELINQIPSIIISRPSIVSFIGEAARREVFIKVVSKDDKRKKSNPQINLQKNTLLGWMNF